jgi:hypothetical protein
LNIYDVHKKCVGSLCYDFSLAQKFLNDPAVRSSLGVGDRKWEMCSGKVHEDMMADWMRNLEPTIPPMLEGGLRVMIYAGENDFICNWLGNHRWVKAMEWSGRAAFNAAMPEPFVVDGTTAGDVTELEGSLSFVKVSESGPHGSDGSAAERGGDAPKVHQRRGHRRRGVEAPCRGGDRSEGGRGACGGFARRPPPRDAHRRVRTNERRLNDDE